MKHRWGALMIAGVALGAGLPLAVGGREAIAGLTRLTPAALALFPGLVLIAWNLNATRLRLLAAGLGHHISHRSALASQIAIEFAGAATPGGTGGPVTCAWLLHRGGVPAARALAIYTFDQILDLVFFLAAALVLVLAWLAGPPGHLPGWPLAVLTGLLSMGLAGLWISLRHYRRLALAAGRILTRLHISSRRRRHIARWLVETRNALRLIRGFPARRLLLLYLLCATHWLLRYSILYLALRLLGDPVSWAWAFLVQMAALSFGQAFLLPGGSGGAEAAAMALLAPVTGTSDAAAAVLVWRLAAFYWYLAAGAPVFAWVAGRPLWRRLTANAGAA